VGFNERKFKELVVYIARRLGPEAALGRVKLAKLLMQSDFSAYQRTGQPITGATYEKWEQGHLPRELLLAQRDLVEGAIKLYGHESATYLSHLAHRELGWILAEDREVIPYQTALLDSERPPGAVFEELRELHGLK
jgi:hypothetical protein